MTTRELNRLLDLLGKLSEHPDVSGAMKDDIAHVRHLCWALLDGEVIDEA